MQQTRWSARGIALVVSGTPDVVSGLIGHLRAARIEVLRTARCIEAVALADVVEPQLVLVDWEVPGAEGLCAQLARAARPGQAVLVLAPPGADVTVPPGCEVVGFDIAAPGAVLQRAEALVAEAHDLRAASPLTGLPGNAAIRLELERRMAAGAPVALVYIDIDNFKPYNDHYGFLRGDDVIRMVAALLRDQATQHAGAFVGHVGGDDFVLLACPQDADDIAGALLRAFDAAVPTLYDVEDAERGYIEAEDRRGHTIHWPLLSLSIGIATSVQHRVLDPLALVDVATEMKHVAKQQTGNAVAVDRRDTTRTRGLTARRRVRLFGALRRVVGTALVAVAITLPAMAVATAHAAPGDRLWPVTRVLEDARLAVAGEERPALHAELAGRRLGDLAAALAAGDEQRASHAAFEYARHLGSAGDAPAFAARREQHARLLERLRASACEQGTRTPMCGAVMVALRAADAGSPRAAGSPAQTRDGPAVDGGPVPLPDRVGGNTDPERRAAPVEPPGRAGTSGGERAEPRGAGEAEPPGASGEAPAGGKTSGGGTPSGGGTASGSGAASGGNAAQSGGPAAPGEEARPAQPSGRDNADGADKRGKSSPAAEPRRQQRLPGTGGGAPPAQGGAPPAPPVGKPPAGNADPTDASTRDASEAAAAASGTARERGE